jgi:hypothetical protein
VRGVRDKLQPFVEDLLGHLIRVEPLQSLTSQKETIGLTGIDGCGALAPRKTAPKGYLNTPGMSLKQFTLTL